VNPPVVDLSGQTYAGPQVRILYVCRPWVLLQLIGDCALQGLPKVKSLDWTEDLLPTDASHPAAVAGYQAALGFPEG